MTNPVDLYKEHFGDTNVPELREIISEYENSFVDENFTYYAATIISIVSFLFSYFTLNWIYFVSSMTVCSILFLFTDIKPIIDSITIFGVGSRNSVSGSFTLGSGTIKTTNYYIYFTQGNHGLIKSRVNSDYTEIIETDEVKPTLLTVGSKHYLIVPKNTIIKEFEIEAD